MSRCGFGALIFLLESAVASAATAGKLALPVGLVAPGAATQPALSATEKAFLDALTAGKEDPVALSPKAQTLLVSKSPAATAALANLLASAGAPATRIAICEAIANRPEGSVITSADQYVAPLITLLGTDNEALRNAAVSALGRYRSHDVPKKLGQAASDPKQPLPQRLAALDALSRINHEDAITALLPLVGDKTSAIQQQALRALQQSTDQSTGADVAAWQAWWKQNRGAWAYQRIERLEKALADYEQTVARLRGELTTANRALYTNTPNGKKQALHVSWFQHSEEVLRELAIELVRESSLENKKVAPPIEAALRQRIGDSSATVRKKAVAVVGLLRAAGDAKLLLGQLGSETDSGVKAEIVKALGQIADPSAVAELVKAVNDPALEVVIEAATALGVLGKKGAPTAAATAKPAAEALDARFKSVAANDVALAGAMLRAMGQIVDPRFAPHFEGYVGAADATLREAAIRGLAQLSDPKHLPVMLERLGDPAPGVRTAAATAVGILGTGAAELDRLLARVVDGNETDAVGNAAWAAILAIVGKSKLDVPTQLKFAERVRATPKRYVQLVAPIEQKLAALQKVPPELADVREKLGDAQALVGQHGEAEKLFEKAYQQFVAAKDNKRAAVSAQHRVASLLRLNRLKDAMEYAGKAAGNPEPSTATAMATRVQAFVDECMKAKQPERVIELHPHLKAHLYPKIAKEQVAKFDAALAAAQAARVKALVPGLTGGDAAKKAAADKEVKAMGKAAIRPLAQALDEVLAAKTVNAAAEKSLYDVLKTLAGDAWPGYDAKLPPDQKRATLKGLLGG